MKLIENKKVSLYGRARNIAVVAKAAVVDTEGAHTTVAHFLHGENPWGFHQDMRFSLPVGNVKSQTVSVIVPVQSGRLSAVTVTVAV